MGIFFIAAIVLQYSNQTTSLQKQVDCLRVSRHFFIFSAILNILFFLWFVKFRQYPNTLKNENGKLHLFGIFKLPGLYKNDHVDLKP